MRNWQFCDAEGNAVTEAQISGSPIRALPSGASTNLSEGTFSSSARSPSTSKCNGSSTPKHSDSTNDTSGSSSLLTRSSLSTCQNCGKQSETSHKSRESSQADRRRELSLREKYKRRELRMLERIERMEMDAMRHEQVLEIEKLRCECYRRIALIFGIIAAYFFVPVLRARVMQWAE